MAHELNTPLGVARTAASFLTSELRNIQKQKSHSDVFTAAPTDSFVESSEIVEHNVERAVRLVRSVRAVLYGQLVNNRTDVNLQEYASLNWASIGARLDAAGLSYDVSAPNVTVRLNPHILDEVFAILAGNTLTNAFPDTQTGHLEVTVSDADHRLELDYRHSGVGIAPSRRQIVFEPFQTTREQGRIGIGLYVLSPLVDRFNGSVSILPRGGPGARFLVALMLEDDQSHS